jgi:iron complex outermembrane recepter protein
MIAAAQWLVILATGSSAKGQSASASPAPTAATGGELQQVTVTGYLIPRVGDGPQPVTTYGQDYIDKTGSQTVSDILQNLPGAVGNWSPSYTTGFGFSPGSTSVALKGLPPNDTLTLVDGLRYPQYPFPQVSTGAITSFVDLNSIPTGAIDRIEILNDGGSATYGTDAVAGW